MMLIAKLKGFFSFHTAALAIVVLQRLEAEGYD